MDSGRGDVYEPTAVVGLEEEAVARVALGFQHAVALTKSGDVFTWGK